MLQLSSMSTFLLVVRDEAWRPFKNYGALLFVQ